MNPVKSIVSGFAKGANYRDRSEPAEAWWFVGFGVFTALIAVRLDLVVWRGLVADFSVDPPIVGSSYGGNLAASVWAVLFLGPSFALACRRLRDSNLRTDRLALPALVAGAMLIIAFVDPLGVERSGRDDGTPLFMAEGWAMLGTPGFGRVLLNEALVALAPFAPWMLLGPSLTSPSTSGPNSRRVGPERIGQLRP